MEEYKWSAAEIIKMLQKETIPCMKIKLLREGTPSLLESKFGGLGYVPHGVALPEDSKGVQLRLLAQIDCSQITILDFPHAGLLQFWVRNDDVSGADFDNENKQDGFRICYYPEVDQTVTEEEVAAKVGNNLPFGEDLFPVDGCYGLQFMEDTDCISSCDYRWEEHIKSVLRQMNPEQAEQLLKEEDALEELLEEIDTYLEELEAETGSNGLDAFGHKMGGYPGFTQWDPRGYAEDSPYDVLLFQMDSDFWDGKDRILWGDAGIANFFISSEKLKQCDFSDVVYNWDCY